MQNAIIPNIMTLFTDVYWLLFLLIGCFASSIYLKDKLGALFNPTLVTTVVVIGFMLITNTPYEKFEYASSFITFWLQPAVVCLAVPLYIQWQKIKSQWAAIIISQAIGSVIGIVTGVLFVKWLGGGPMSMLSVAAKSVTMPIAIEVSEQTGGIVGITSFSVIVAGVFGQMIGLGFFVKLKLNNPISQSLAIGSGSHALGIAAIAPKSERYVAYGTVGLIVNGIFTAVMAPMVLPFLVSA